jgi:L-ascorbate metabolism protein UlaG (beta-lactamase superfamily)
MIIQWFGHSCFKIQAKIRDRELTVVTDPYDSSAGLKLPKIHANIVTSSHDNPSHNNIAAIAGVDDQQVFAITSPGEYEKSGIFIRGILSYCDKLNGEQLGVNTIYRIDLENLSVVHLGSLGHILTTEQLELINGVDILLIPVGCVDTINIEEVSEVIAQIEPKIVIPMHYRTGGETHGVKTGLESVDKFLHSMGMKDADKLPKFKISVKDLEFGGSRKIIVLDKS